ncbi:MAG: hypothetical protein FJZ58_08040, partial [Chlamydiae bacterium]|nr:hypothetical protein [Chlamydiota bacterium]
EHYTYDPMGHIIEKQIQDAGGNILLQRFFEYNPQDQCVEEYYFKDNVKTTLVKTEYNSYKEPISYIDGLGHKTHVIIDNHFVNTLGQTVVKKTVTVPLGMHTEIEFDTLGRVYSLSKKDATGKLLSSQKNLYDTLGNKAVEIHDQVIEGQIVSTRRTQWIHGPMGRLDEEIQAAGSSLARKIHYSYNSLGQLIEKRFPEYSLQYTYDQSGYLCLVKSQHDREVLQICNDYSYDHRGNITSARALHGLSIERTYTPFNQVAKETIKDGEGTYTLHYSYDRKGRLKTISLPDQSTIIYGYDALFGREIHRTSPQGEVLYTHTYDSYDTQGRLLTENHIGYIGSHEYLYDEKGQKVSDTNDFFTEEYVRDGLGRVTGIQNNEAQEYLYNDLSQLISEKKTIAKTYSYDSLDNRMTADNEALIYNALNQLTFYSKAEFFYDQQGNLLRKILDGEESHFMSNALSQLISIEKKDHTALIFSYDPFGRLLVEKQVDLKGKHKKILSTTRYLYIGHQEIGTLSSTGALETLKVPALSGDTLGITSVAFELNKTAYVPLHDIAGNVAFLLDPQDRSIVERYEYSAFGEEAIFTPEGTREKTSPLGNPWRFAEKRCDEKSGLILFGLRFYDPTIGRWISQDP